MTEWLLSTKGEKKIYHKCSTPSFISNEKKKDKFNSIFFFFTEGTFCTGSSFKDADFQLILFPFNV